MDGICGEVERAEEGLQLSIGVRRGTMGLKLLVNKYLIKVK